MNYDNTGYCSGHKVINQMILKSYLKLERSFMNSVIIITMIAFFELKECESDQEKNLRKKLIN